MKVSPNIFKSKIARRIVALVLVSTIVPLILVSWISISNNQEVVQQYEQLGLKEQSKNYALTTFSKLNLAKQLLIHLAATPEKSIHQFNHDSSSRLEIFSSLIYTTADGKVLSQYNQPSFVEQLKNIIPSDLKADRSQLVILPNDKTDHPARILMVTPVMKDQTIQSLLIGELDSDYIWGQLNDYPENINLCVYRELGKSQENLFCSNRTMAKKLHNSQNEGAWELFLKGEFNNYSWLFVTNSAKSTDQNNVSTLINTRDYILVTAISFLIAGLLSIKRIRTVMVPLDELTAAVKKVSKGDFSPVIIDARSDFTEFADAFNKMSFEINEKISTLETFSAIDSEIASKLNVEEIIEQVFQRMRHLKPNASFFIFRIEEKTDTDIHCNITIFCDGETNSKRVSIATSEIAYITSQKLGQIIDVAQHCSSIREKVLSECNGQYFWVYPMYWQEVLNGFIFVGSHQNLNPHDTIWQEYRDLARRISIATSTQAKEDLLIRQSQHDMLTGLPNRILLEDRLQHAIEHSNRTNKPVLVIFLDLDRFKQINDSMGHQVGDAVLLHVANSIKENLREVDTVARFGGDEFVIVLNSEAREGISSDILNRLLNSVAQPIKVSEKEIAVTCSMGISVYPNDSINPDELIRYADIAMYRAKELGKNNFQFFTNTMNIEAEKQMRIYSLLRGALEREEFSLLYQPKVNITTRKIVGVEALIRWNNPELGTVSPLNFIPLAEETGLIIPIGNWVLQTACKQAAYWQENKADHLTMSVNVSARQFSHPDFLTFLSNAIAESGLEAGNLDIELTESSLFEYTDDSIEILNKIKEIGVSISIDDFGTGFSNLSYLSNFPINTLKIDKSFIDKVEKDTLKSPIVDTIITLAKSLNMNIVAEGVEIKEQAEYLAIRGCSQIQGYYFSPPVRAEIISGMLSTIE